MKKFLFIISTIFSLFLFSCSLLNNNNITTNKNTSENEPKSTNESPNSTSENINISTTIKNSPKLELVLDEFLTYSIDDNIYLLNFYIGDEYKININVLNDLDHKTKIEFSSSDYFNITEENIISVKTTKYNSISSDIYIFLKDENDKEIDRIKFKATASMKTYDVSITFNKEMSYDKKYDRWFFNLKYNETFEIKPQISGIDEYNIKYELLNNDSNELINLSTDGKVSLKENILTESYHTIKISVYDKLDNFQKFIFVTVMVNGTQESDNLSYLDSNIILESSNDDITIEESKYYDYKLKLSYPHIKYELPNFILTNYEGEYVLEFENKSDNFTIDKENNKYFITSNTKYLPPLKVIAKNNEEKITSIDIEFEFTEEGRGLFYLKDINGNIYKDNDTLNLYEDDIFYLEPIYNNYYNALTYKYDINQSLENNNSNISLNETYKYSIIKTNNASKGEINYKLIKEDSTNTSYEYNIKLNINISKRKLNELYVRDPKKIIINNTNLILSTKIIAKFDGNKEITVNGDNNLNYEIINTANPNIFNVKFSYTKDDITKTCIYEVNKNSTSELTKTELNENYYDYNLRLNIHQTPLEGDVKALIIPIWFTDSSLFFDLNLKNLDNKNPKEQMIEDLNDVLFGNNNTNDYKSLNYYYLEESTGKLRITGKITDWYNASNSYKDYYGLEKYNSSYISYDDLAKQAVDWYFSNSNEDVSDYDSNNDGAIDALMLYYAAPYLSYPSTDDEYFEAGRGFVSTTSGLNRIYNKFSFIPLPNIYNEAGKIDAQNKLKSSSSLKNINGLSSKTSIHEFGHLLGLIDYYDTSNFDNHPAGKYTMQDSNYGAHDPYSIISFGWASPYVFDSSLCEVGYEIEIEISSFIDSGDCILLSNNFSGSPFEEYILIELFDPIGINKEADSLFNNPKIRIWHVNATLENNMHKYSNKTDKNATDNNTFDLLHYIRNDKTALYGIDAKDISENNEFDVGDIFTLDLYKSQFINNNLLDNGKELGWKVEIIEIIQNNNIHTAKIKLTRI